MDDKMNWIKTSERLPEFEKTVVCFYKNFHDVENVFMGKLGTPKNFSSVWWLNQADDFHCAISDVKYWIPLPPEEQE